MSHFPILGNNFPESYLIIIGGNMVKHELRVTSCDNNIADGQGSYLNQSL